MHEIPFNKPTVVGNEIDFVQKSIAGRKLSGDGEFTKQCSVVLERVLCVPKILLTTSCTSALEMTALLINADSGSEIIVPSFTFVSTVNAFALRGAKPIFADIREDTLNIDESRIEGLINDKTRAIVVVHYAGVGCNMVEICKIVEKHKLVLIEDNAHGLFGKYKNQYLGTFGALSTQSFHETKNFTCGEGGALLINDKQYIERAEIIREKGTNRSKFYRGQVDKYSWVDIGSSYLPSDILSAFLSAQINSRIEIQAKRKKIWDKYYVSLHTWSIQQNIRLPTVPLDCEQTYHMFYLVMPDLDSRQRFISYMQENKIQCVFHYLPLHLSEMGRRFGGKVGDCEITESISDRLVRLPFFYDLNESDLDRVIETTLGFQV
jgi:dTDP-4-amino-4,6-dideoxygalactose transaminase